MFHTHTYDTSTVTLHELRANDVSLAVLATFDENVRSHELDHFRGGILWKNRHEIHTTKGEENLRAFVGRIYRAIGAFQPPNGIVVIDGDDETVAMRRRLLDQLDVPGMQQVEASVGEHDSVPTPP